MSIWPGGPALTNREKPIRIFHPLRINKNKTARQRNPRKNSPNNRKKPTGKRSKQQFLPAIDILGCKMNTELLLG
jgi:hypothetical protein